MSDSDAKPSADVVARVDAVIRDVLGLDAGRLSPSSRLKEDLGADSVDAVVLVMALEREFKGQMSDAEAAGLSTVGDIAGYISLWMGKQTS